MNKYEQFLRSLPTTKQYVDFWMELSEKEYGDKYEGLKVVSFEKLPKDHELYKKIGRFYCGHDGFSPVVKDLADYLTEKYQKPVRGISIRIHLNIMAEPVITLAPAWSWLRKIWAGQDITDEFGVVLKPMYDQNTILKLVQEINDVCKDRLQRGEL